MQPDILYPVAYPCSYCGEALEATTDEWQDWLRCPSCGKAGRPPFQRKVVAAPADDVLYIGTFTTGPSAGGNGTAGGYATGRRPGSTLPGRDEGSGSGRRVVLGLGFFLAVFLALVSVVQRNPTQAGVFGFVACMLIVFLAQSSRRG